MTTKIKKNKTVLLIGHGYWGKKIFSVLNSFFDWQVLIYDRAENELSLDDFLVQNSSFSHVIIATPEKTHYQLAKKFLLLNKNVLVEKPLCLLKEEAKELIDLARERKLFLLVDYIFLYDNFLLKIKEILQENKLGKIKKIEIFRSSPGFAKPNLLVSDDLMIHDLYLLRYLFDQKINLIDFSILSRIDNQQLGLKFNLYNDLLVRAFYSWLEPVSGRSLVFSGEKASLAWKKDLITEQLILAQDKKQKNISIAKNNNPLLNLLDKFLNKPKLKEFEKSYNDYLNDVEILSLVRNAFYAKN